MVQLMLSLWLDKQLEDAFKICAEKTVGGCLCAPDWSMGPGATVGKPHYRDRCARPEAPDGEQQ
jgi:hypothetical protein